ncbi:hypothetical protein DUNSADRAFT_17597 [Dunaliella salina]|uniref:Aminomethyltransferase n=2 Tax=Dunaliella salina TaxID=3046 RepID=A0ABQ7G1F9_DUNSA|nr:hypothetical protein DUNSADRAFT_17597 [Dunaliella salina]|eukprot:KAF5828447.1 hypothetical protein DUNSADRAFT_17597 [Dunaliella salina]
MSQVFVTASARTLDIGTVLINQSNTLVITSPETKQQLLERFDKYIFPADKVQGCVLMGQDEWDCARILAGRPAVGAELTEDFNPLEAGLCKAVSVDKGCYIGQETLSKVTNLNAVKQQLWGFELEGPVEAGSSLTDQDGARLGRITSVTTTPDGRNFALGYIRCKSSGKQVDVEGKEVKVADIAARVVPIRYASRMVVTDDPSEEQQKQQKAEDERKSAEEAKAERLRQMQERLAAYQQQVQAAKGQ